MAASKPIRQSTKKKAKTTKSTKTTKKPKKLNFKGNKRILPFILLFGIIGSVFAYMTFAASNTVTYSGQLSSSQPTQNYTISAGDSGNLTAKHNSKDTSMRVAIVDKTGTVLAEKAGSNASVSTTVFPGTYSIRMDYIKEIKGAKKYKVTITYPIMETPPPPASDTTPPTALITSPTSDSVSATVAFSATAIDNVAVSKVDFLVDGTVVSSDTSSPYTYSWNTLFVADGSHDLQIKAYDTSNNIGVASRPITVVNSVVPPPPPTTYPAALWHANADTDTSTDTSTETNYWKKEVTSSIWSRLRIVNDPLGVYGKVYYANITAADIAAGNKRAEWRGSYNGSGGSASNQIKFAESQNLPQNLYMGWRSIFGPDLALNNNENDGNFMQLKGDSSCGGPAVGITVRYNRLSIRTIDEAYNAWNGPLMTTLMNNQWHSFVLHVNFSKDASTGYLELWLDGQPQTMTNGQTRVSVPTVCPNDAHVFPKFGTYGMDVGKGVGPEHWVESPRIGTSYESVVPR